MEPLSYSTSMYLPSSFSKFFRVPELMVFYTDILFHFTDNFFHESLVSCIETGLQSLKSRWWGLEVELLELATALKGR